MLVAGVGALIFMLTKTPGPAPRTPERGDDLAAGATALEQVLVGIILDDVKKRPLQGVRVVVSEYGKEARTDVDGRFELKVAGASPQASVTLVNHDPRQSRGYGRW
jgi:hypothetical protein